MHHLHLNTNCHLTVGVRHSLATHRFVMSGGLNLQVEHHLLPGVNHWHLRALQPAIERICAKHGVPYHAKPSLTAALQAS